MNVKCKIEKMTYCLNLVASVILVSAAIPAFAHADRLSVINSKDLPSNQIELHGWAQEFMKRQVDGLTGHPEQSGFPFNTCMWAGYMDVRQREFSQNGSDWWPYEQTAYYLDGALRAAYLTRSKPLLDRVHNNIKYVIDNADSSGQMGAERVKNDSWPMVVFMRMLFQEYECTKDTVLLEAIEKHYQAVYGKNDLSGVSELKDFDLRAVLHVEHLCNLTKITGDSWYLDQAEKLYDSFTESSYAQKNSQKMCLTAKGMSEGIKPQGHGVTYHEFLKLPAILYICTGKELYRKALEQGLSMLTYNHELADGLTSSVESLCGKRTDLGHELCDAVDFNWACGWALLATGQASYADKMEKVLYNAGFSSITSDFKAHQYYGAPNMPISTDASCYYNDHNSWGYQTKDHMCYRPGHSTECCTGNMHRMFPTFLNRMCMIQNDAVNLVFYLPATVTIPFGSETLTIKQITDYPFSNQIRFEIQNTPAKQIALRLRIPGWATAYEIKVNDQSFLNGTDNGTFIELNHKLNKGDAIDLTLHTKPVIDRRDRGLAVNYGPLVFSLPVEAKQTLTTDDGVGKCSPDFPAYEFVPKKPKNWAYALPQSITPDQVKVMTRDMDKYPWDAGNSPIKLKVPARKVENWHLEKWIQATDFPKDLKVQSKDLTLTLEPIGGTMLRITEFPKYN